MIGKIRNIQDSWFMKGILILTALSFMSLFGISGYLGSAAQNKTVIKVDDIVITQNQISQELNREIQMAHKLFGENLEINDDMRQTLLQNLVQKELASAILKKTAQDNNVKISMGLIQQIIRSMPDFRDAQGNFNANMMKQALSAAGWSEGMYIDTLKNDVIAQHLAQNPVLMVNVPQFMAEYINKLNNQKKVFKYIIINPNDMKIDRKISDDELEQYYNDFANQFVEPEKRDVSFISFSLEEAAAQSTPSKDEIKQYYDEHVSQFVTPEKRTVLQMLFENEDAAKKAWDKLKAGSDFYAVAKSDANQSKEDTELGDVSQDMLIANMGEEVFKLKQGGFTAPQQSEFGWHIMKVTDIKPMKKTPEAVAYKQIVETLQQEKAYEAAETLAMDIEDMVGSGKSLPEVAKALNLKVFEVKKLAEDGSVQNAPKQFEALVKSQDFADNAFSYNIGEVSQVFETDKGFAALVVDAIQEARQMSVEEVKPQIIDMWENNERAAIAQEIINDVTNDLENGDNIDEIATRFKLPLKTSKALTRSESFAGLSQAQMSELFKEGLNSPKTLKHGEEQIIAVNTKVINSKVKPSRGDLVSTSYQASIALSQDMVQQLIKDYGTNYDVRVKYKNVGLAD